jgi:hypothetical protein
MSRSSILLPGEDIRFQSLVSTTSLKRRPSKLLSITTKKKTKARMLILTGGRLICVKIGKGGKVLTIRGEWAISKVTTGKEKSNSEKPKPDKEKGGKKGKDSVNQTIVSVDPKGEKEFVVLTVCLIPLLWANSDLPCLCQMTKSHSFIVEDSALRSNWVSKIQRTLDPAAA